jgi:hypothetical protein
MRTRIAAALALGGVMLGGCAVVAVTAAVGAAAVSVAGTAVGVAVDVTGAAVSGVASVAGAAIDAATDDSAPGHAGEDGAASAPDREAAEAPGR